MDRRNFCKAIILSPFLPPFLLASKVEDKNDLYVLSDEPHKILPSVFKELRKGGIRCESNYAFLGRHPHQKALEQALAEQEWNRARSIDQAPLTLSFQSLQRPVRPSFTLVQNGRIRDLRSGRLYSLWKEINRTHVLTACLTRASFLNNPIQPSPGRSVCIYRDGRKIADLSLKKSGVKHFSVQHGQITVQMENGKVWIPASSCRHKICCQAPPVSLSGERIICAPNHFMLEMCGPGSVDTVIG